MRHSATGGQLFTIGYGGRTPTQFLALLEPHRIRTVADIRLRPDRASLGIWTKAKTPDKGIEAWLLHAGYSYRSLIELGNLFLVPRTGRLARPI